MSKRTQGHGPSAQKNEWAPRQRDANVYIFFNKQQTTNNTKSVTTEQAGEQVSMPARQRKGGKQDGGAARSTRAFLRAARASRNLHDKNLYRMKEREASGYSPTTLLPLYARSLFPPRLPPFIGQERSRSGINFLPTESNYLGSTYVLNSLVYTTKNVRARRAGPRALVHRLRLGTVFFTTTCGS